MSKVFACGAQTVVVSLVKLFTAIENRLKTDATYFHMISDWSDLLTQMFHSLNDKEQAALDLAASLKANQITPGINRCKAVGLTTVDEYETNLTSARAHAVSWFAAHGLDSTQISRFDCSSLAV